MGTRTIGLRDEVYDRLAREKREGESFIDVVDRLLDERNADWRHGFASLDDKAAAELERVVTEQRTAHAEAAATRQEALFEHAAGREDGDGA
jgi:predicted CopG family antitoxin